MKKLTIPLIAALLASTSLMAAPKDVFDFTHWKLTLPIGSSTYNPTEISSSQIESGYSNSSYFYSNSANSYVVFRAPVEISDSAYTSSSAGGARCELREQPTAGEDNYWNYTSGTKNQLYTQMKVRQLPVNNSGKLVIGQIHGKDTNPPIKLQIRYNDSTTGKVSCIYNTSASGSSSKSFDIGTAPLNKTIKYYIKTYKSSSKWYLSVKVKYGSTVIGEKVEQIGGSLINSNWEDEGAYFKAGLYNQTKDGSGSSDESVCNMNKAIITHKGTTYMD